jgi:predicted TIM-barrel fold metal-dependent hydrolase
MTIAEDENVLISADSHVMEPYDLWEKNLPAQFRDAAPKFNPPREGGGGGGEGGNKPGGTDPHERLKEMSQDGVSAEVLYPTRAMRHFGLEDPELQEACLKVYNDWIIEYCQIAGDRLVGIPCISVYNIPNAIKELERCHDAGLRGAMIWQAPHPDLRLYSEHYNPFWEACQRLQAPVNLHILTGFSYHQTTGGGGGHGSLGVEAYRNSVNNKLIDGAQGLFDVVMYGILDRYPELKVVIVENEIGWIPFLVQQWDYYAHRFGRINPLPMEHDPSFYVDRQVHATFFNDSVGAHLLSRWGQDNRMWSSDYPHGNSTWPNSRKVIERDLGYLPEDIKSKIVRENVAKLYNLKIPSLLKV